MLRVVDSIYLGKYSIDHGTWSLDLKHFSFRLQQVISLCCG